MKGMESVGGYLSRAENQSYNDYTYGSFVTMDKNKWMIQEHFSTKLRHYVYKLNNIGWLYYMGLYTKINNFISKIKYYWVGGVVFKLDLQYSILWRMRLKSQKNNRLVYFILSIFIYFLKIIIIFFSYAVRCFFYFENFYINFEKIFDENNFSGFF
jgi:hypothetical protein